MPNESPLAGIGVLVTRPTARADSLCTLIAQHGGRAIKFPVFEIVATHCTQGDELSTAVSEMDAAALVIFVSVPAVEAVAGEMKRQQIKLSSQTKVAVLGAKTAAACQAAGINVDVLPETFNSEGVLESLREFDVADKTVFIFRAQSGRELLKRELESRGANVRYVESYRRIRTEQPIAPLIAAWQAGKINFVIIGSVEVWDALCEKLGALSTLLKATPIIAYSERIAAHIRAQQHSDVLVAAAPTDEAAVEIAIEIAAQFAQKSR